MHDPMTVAFEIRNPFSRAEYRPTWITIWHVDPEKDGTDDSCGWFMRARHGKKEVLERIVKRFEHDWDKTFKGSQASYLCGLFAPNGEPHFTVPGVALNLFFIAACEHFDSNGHTNWKKARRFMQKNLFDILHFAENVTDSLHDGITRKFETGCGEPYTARAREERIRSLASCVYGWILRVERPWYRHPRWHFWHWKIQIHPLQKFRRWLLSRCCVCGKRFRWGEPVAGRGWSGPLPRRFECLRGEREIMHTKCGNHRVTG